MVLAFFSKFWEVLGTHEWYFVILQMQVEWWEYHEGVETLKPYHIQKNLFELFALTGGGKAKTSGGAFALKSHHCKLPQHLWSNHTGCYAETIHTGSVWDQNCTPERH